jgi:hypothetical protein
MDQPSTFRAQPNPDADFQPGFVADPNPDDQSGRVVDADPCTSDGYSDARLVVWWGAECDHDGGADPYGDLPFDKRLCWF